MRDCDPQLALEPYQPALQMNYVGPGNVNVNNVDIGHPRRIVIVWGNVKPKVTRTRRFPNVTILAARGTVVVATSPFSQTTFRTDNLFMF